MLFNSFTFASFFIVVLGVFWSLPKPMRAGWLLVSSLVFYAAWIPQYVLLLLLMILVNYGLLLGVVRTAHARLYLAISLILSLGTLAYFKYADFLVSSSAHILDRLGVSVQPPGVLLPLGISFVTFMMMGLAIDAYRHRGIHARSFSEYALFVTFFPHLIAGPILRGSELIPQLRSGGYLDRGRAHRALWLITAGLSKKVVFADTLLAPYANAVFTSPGFAPAPDHLLAMYSFAFQIYFDFSGYTDIGRGCALLLGYELPMNFREPYLARDPSEFWRRWHMTLSQWLRDYLYVSLGGNRVHPARVYINLFLTMLLGGLWHGAGWNFLIWGGLHGLLLVAHRMVGGSRQDPERPLAVTDIVRIVLLFNVICVLWVFFRAPTFGEATTFLLQLVAGPWRSPWPIFQCAVIAVCVGLHWCERAIRENQTRLQAWTATGVPAAIESFAIGLAVGVVLLLGGFGGEFIYFQF
ncbi:MAG: MBOAT family protein [Deltaproteobacteria bacterium]|nr:MBOAT family protein [Deltaproteobacteria bacterium]